MLRLHHDKHSIIERGAPDIKFLRTVQLRTVQRTVLMHDIMTSRVRGSASVLPRPIINEARHHPVTWCTLTYIGPLVPSSVSSEAWHRE